MNPELSELRDSIRQVLESAGPAADEQLAWNGAVELGWLMTAASEGLGGLGLGVAGMLLVGSELGRKVSRIPSIAALASIDALVHASMPERVEALMAGEYLALPLADPDVHCSGDTLSGGIEALPSLGEDTALLAWTADHELVFVLPAGSERVVISQTPTWDPTRRLSCAHLDAVAIAGVDVIAEGEQARDLVERILTIRDLLIAADSVGVAHALLEMTIEHLKLRHQFGRPLAMFQALKHRVADLRAQVDAASALLDGSGAFADEEGAARRAATAAIGARHLAGEVAARVAEEALQLHGGIGMAAEHDCHLYLKRALLNRTLGRQSPDYATEVARRFIDDCRAGA